MAAGAGRNTDRRRFVDELRQMAIRNLRKMFIPEEGLFCFCLRRMSTGVVVEGVSRRYTATALIALAEMLDLPILHL